MHWLHVWEEVRVVGSNFLHNSSAFNSSLDTFCFFSGSGNACNREKTLFRKTQDVTSDLNLCPDLWLWSLSSLRYFWPCSMLYISKINYMAWLFMGIITWYKGQITLIYTSVIPRVFPFHFPWTLLSRVVAYFSSKVFISQISSWEIKNRFTFKPNHVMKSSAALCSACCEGSIQWVLQHNQLYSCLASCAVSVGCMESGFSHFLHRSSWLPLAS